MGCRPCGPRFFDALGFPFFPPPSLCLVGQDELLSTIGAKGTAFYSRWREARLQDQCSRAGISEMES
jgi:hypothetical protein